MFIAGYNCITAAGLGSASLMDALYSGSDCSTAGSADGGRVCLLKNRSLESKNYKEQLVSSLNSLWTSVQNNLSDTVLTDVKKKRVGFIFCSTKGYVEDYIWNKNQPSISQDPFSEIVSCFTEAHSLISWSLKFTISNACSSSHAGLEYAQELLKADRLDYVVVAAGDLIGPFVYKGFSVLKVLSHRGNKPFDQTRDGLQLGDGIAIMLLAKNPDPSFTLQIKKVATETEGSLITRPSLTGEGLLKSLQKITPGKEVIPADVIIAHGTGTVFNDLTEDLAFAKYFENQAAAPVIGTKWCIGHTLGASGLIDLIAASEIIKRQKIFSLATTKTLDAKLKMTYLTSVTELNDFPNQKITSILTTSLGFGGVHAALWLQSVEI